MAVLGRQRLSGPSQVGGGQARLVNWFITICLNHQTAVQAFFTSWESVKASLHWRTDLLPTQSSVIVLHWRLGFTRKCTQQPWSVSQDGSSWRSCGRASSFPNWLLGRAVIRQYLSHLPGQSNPLKHSDTQLWSANVIRSKDVSCYCFYSYHASDIRHLQSTVKS